MQGEEFLVRALQNVKLFNALMISLAEWKCLALVSSACFKQVRQHLLDDAVFRISGSEQIKKMKRYDPQSIKLVRFNASDLSMLVPFKSCKSLELCSQISSTSVPLPSTLMRLIVTDPLLKLPTVPNTLTHLIVNYYEKTFPPLPSLQYLKIKKNVPPTFPPNLTHLILHANSLAFSGKSPMNLAGLPQTLTHLRLPEAFNQPVDGLLPPLLTHLTFGNAFDKPVDKLPSSLVFLSLRENFNQKLNNLPASLRQLSISGVFNKDVNSLPPQLTHLSMSSHNHLFPSLPPALTHLQLVGTYAQDTLSLSYLHALISLSITFDVGRIVLVLPPSLRFLRYSGECGLSEKTTVPPGTQHLVVGERQSFPMLISDWQNEPVSL